MRRRQGQAIKALAERGAHFVVAAADKRPLDKGWQRQGASVDRAIEAHADEQQLLGIIPASIDMTALDIDHGDADKIADFHPPAARLRTRRRGGEHFYYPDPRADRRNMRFDFNGVRGDVRGRRGYTGIHQADGPTVLLAGIDGGEDATDFAVLFEDDAFSVNRPRAAAPRAAPAAAAAQALPLAQVGQRHISLFEAVRQALYQVGRAHVRAGWHNFFIDHGARVAADMNTEMPTPLPPAEAVRIGREAADWTWRCWRRRKLFDPEDRLAQALYGRMSGQARRDRTAERDTAILVALDEGLTYRAVAAQFGVSRGAVCHVARRARA